MQKFNGWFNTRSFPGLVHLLIMQYLWPPSNKEGHIVWLLSVCLSVGMSVGLSTNCFCSFSSQMNILKWKFVNRFIMIISNGNIMIIALPFTSTRNSLSFFIQTFKMILFVLYKVNSLYNVKGGFGDVCVCVRGGGGGRRGVNLSCSFFFSTAII